MNHDRHLGRLRRRVVAAGPGRRILRRLRRGAPRRRRVAPAVIDGFNPSARAERPLVRDSATLPRDATAPSAVPRSPDSIELAVTLLPGDDVLRFLSLLLRGDEARVETNRVVVKRAPRRRSGPASCASSPRLYARNAASDRVGRCSIAFRSAVVSVMPMSANSRSTMFFSSVNSWSIGCWSVAAGALRLRRSARSTTNAFARS